MLASELYPDYPDPMPAFQYLGGDHGKGLLESALAEPQQQFGGRYLHRTIYDKAAALFRSVIKNHALVDGNKRLALTTLSLFLAINGRTLYFPPGEAVLFALRVAAGSPEVSLQDISRLIRLRCRGVESVVEQQFSGGQLARVILPQAESEQFLERWSRLVDYLQRMASITRELIRLSESRFSDYLTVG